MQLVGSPNMLPPLSAPIGNVIDPGGHFVYVGLSQSGEIQGLSRTVTTGHLTPFSGPPFSTSSPYTAYLAMHPSGAFLFALGNNEIPAYSIDCKTDALTEASIWIASSTTNCSRPRRL